jgi:hypothetical protein
MMEDPTYHAKLLGKINAMKTYTFAYDSKFPNPLASRKLVNGEVYSISINSHTTQRYNRFSMAGKYDRGYTTINFGGEILEKILTIGNPVQFQKIL